MEHNRDLATFLAGVIHAQPKECYRNSILALYTMPGTAVYVEGLLCLADFGLWIQHAWIHADNCIVDVTLHGEPSQSYRPVVIYTKAELDAYRKRNRGTLRMPPTAYNKEHTLLMREAEFKAYRELYGEPLCSLEEKSD